MTWNYVPPQVQVKVELGWQYPALAKKVKGVKAEICAVESAVIVCLVSRFGAGTAWMAIAQPRRIKNANLAIFEIILQRVLVSTTGHFIDKLDSKYLREAKNWNYVLQRMWGSWACSTIDTLHELGVRLDMHGHVIPIHAQHEIPIIFLRCIYK